MHSSISQSNQSCHVFFCISCSQFNRNLLDNYTFNFDLRQLNFTVELPSVILPRRLIKFESAIEGS